MSASPEDAGYIQMCLIIVSYHGRQAMKNERELLRIGAPCSVKQLTAMLAAIDAPEQARISHRAGAFIVSVPVASLLDTTTHVPGASIPS